jgi:hypothetical protein
MSTTRGISTGETLFPHLKTRTVSRGVGHLNIPRALIHRQAFDCCMLSNYIVNTATPYRRRSKDGNSPKKGVAAISVKKSQDKGGRGAAARVQEKGPPNDWTV